MEENVMKKIDTDQTGEVALDLEAVQKQIDEMKTQMESLSKATPDSKISMIVFSGELDKVLASFVIATGAVAMGMDAVLFFTFWGTPVLRDKNKSIGGKDVMGNMFGTGGIKNGWHSGYSRASRISGVFGAIYFSSTFGQVADGPSNTVFAMEVQPNRCHRWYVYRPWFAASYWSDGPCPAATSARTGDRSPSRRRVATSTATGA